ncbi:MAG: hypothetical protein V4484_22150 [Pseudomonadota bacterium]
MFPLKINRITTRPTLRSVPVDALRPRMAAPESPQVTQVEANPAEHERRLLADRRAQERRAQDLPAFLDTRVSQGRRRSSGRRAADLHGQARMGISVKA